MIFAEEILDRVDIVLPHIAKSTAIIVPVSAEVRMYPVRIIRFVLRGPKPHIVIEIFWNFHRLEVRLADPVKLPVKTGYSTDSHFKRPSEHSTFDNFLDRLHGCTHAIEVVMKPEPRVEPEHTTILFHRFNYTLALADSTGHWFFTPDILSCLCSHHGHDPMPVRRRRDVHYINIRLGDQLAEIRISAYAGPDHIHCLLEMLGIYIAQDRNR